MGDREKLQKHPDKDYVHYIFKAIEQGCQIGVYWPPYSEKRNMLSADKNPVVIEEYLAK